MQGKLAVGVDIGGTRMRAALVTKGGTIITRSEAATPARNGPEAVVDQVAILVAKVTSGVARESLTSVGVCAPGPLDTTAGMALSTPTISGFSDYPLRDRLQDQIDLPVFLEHDGHAAAFGEWSFGAGRGFSNMVYVTISTGIGSGAIVDGRLHRGHRGMAGHVGHMTILPGGPQCACGNLGCWEALAAGPAFAILANAQGFSDGAAVFDAARGADARAQALVEQLSRYLGIGLVNLMHIFSPEVIVLGGGVVAGLDLMRPHIERHIAATAMAPFRTIALRKAELGDNPGVLGVAALGFANHGSENMAMKI